MNIIALGACLISKPSKQHYRIKTLTFEKLNPAKGNN